MSQKATLTLEDGSDVSFDATITVQDNFLDKKYFEYLKTLVLGPEFTWNMSVVLGPPPKNNPFIKNDPSDDIQFTHVAYADHNILSDFYSRLGPMFRDMQLYNCMKIKINMLPRQDKFIEHGMHVDYPEAPLGNLTSIFYFNTNNAHNLFVIPNIAFIVRWSTIWDQVNISVYVDPYPAEDSICRISYADSVAPDLST